MFTEEGGSLLEATAEALVNAVNTVGVMGKGIALQFKQAYPANFRAYQAACRRGEVRLGSNGGLDWRDVRPLIIEALGGLPDVHVMMFPPSNSS